MDVKRTNPPKISIFALFVLMIFVSCGGNNMRLKEGQDSFLKLIEKGDFDDLSLTIYYMNPYALTRFPWSVDDLVYGITAINEPPREKNDKNGLYRYKVVVDGKRLEEQIELLRPLGNAALVPVEQESYINARVCYVLESKKNGELLVVSMWGGNDDGDSIFVNGIEVKEDRVFCDVIIPFLPEEAAKELEEYLEKKESR